MRLLQAQADEEWSRHSADFWQSLGPGTTVSNLTYAMSLVRLGSSSTPVTPDWVLT